MEMWSHLSVPGNHFIDFIIDKGLKELAENFEGVNRVGVDT